MLRNTCNLHAKFSGSRVHVHLCDGLSLIGSDGETFSPTLSPFKGMPSSSWFLLRWRTFSMLNVPMEIQKNFQHLLIFKISELIEWKNVLKQVCAYKNQEVPCKKSRFHIVLTSQIQYSETCLYRPLYVTTFLMYRHNCSVRKFLCNSIVLNLLVTEPVCYL